MKKRFFAFLLVLCLLLTLPAYAGAAAPDGKGDVDFDGELTSADARLALRQAVSLEHFNARQLDAARVTGSRDVTAADARIILRMAVYLTDYETEEDLAVETMLSGMTVSQKIAQMIMPAFRYYNGDGVTAVNDETARLLGEYGFAGVILYAQNTQTPEQTLRLTDGLQRANAAGGGTQLLIAADQEGGKITRLVTGTQTPGNMALGATGDPEAARDAASVIGAELDAVGINVNFAPVLDVNCEPKNPVIGVRSFSDSAVLTAALGRGYIRGQQDTDVIACLKHFPGHGDTATDSHTGLPVINKSYEELKKTELVPFKAGIDEGAEMIMTAHIQYPQIETGTYRSKSTGKYISLPATLSKTMLTDVLRRDLGFDGVVVTDAMNMDAIADHFSRLDAAKLAINAGADILLTPVDTSSASGMQQLRTYISDLTALTKQGEISISNVNAAVRRILRLKYRKGLFAPYAMQDLAGAVKTAKATVGCAAHHAREWELAKRAVTMVKNDGALPVTAANKKIVILTAYEDELLSAEYALGRLREEGKLPAGASVTVDTYGESADRLKSTVQNADYVIAISELNGASALNPNNGSGKKNAALDALIRYTHAGGGKFIVLSALLPYDAARFQAADAILLCWSNKGMSEDPRVKDGDVTNYGPNIPAGIYAAFDAASGPQGKLPVNIPALTSAYGYSDRILYPFGYGLTY